MDAELNKDTKPSDTDMVQFYNLVLKPFYQTLQHNLDDIASRLDTRNAFAFQFNAEPDFERKVIDTFRAFKSVHLTEVPMKYHARELSTIATVLGNLRQQRLVVDSPEEQMVVEALRRSNANCRVHRSRSLAIT